MHCDAMRCHCISTWLELAGTCTAQASCSGHGHIRVEKLFKRFRHVMNSFHMATAPERTRPRPAARPGGAAAP